MTESEDTLSTLLITFFPLHVYNPESVYDASEKTFLQVLVVVPEHVIAIVEGELSTVFVNSGSPGSGSPLTTQISVTELPLSAGFLLTVSSVVLSEINKTMSKLGKKIKEI